ncbi:unnamed protein product [Nesidiocoris tenuis]|uniref:RNA-directed DNA polymerase n=1 Tax=Nesidiocoris tenuis TaxID=355587 RepID=A0A6H5H900_9HEMI|nr:unnamed protein product [Nesidiocoris tenuis]
MELGANICHKKNGLFHLSPVNAVNKMAAFLPPGLRKYFFESSRQFQSVHFEMLGLTEPHEFCRLVSSTSDFAELLTPADRYIKYSKASEFRTGDGRLSFAFKQSNEKASPRQLRHLHFISQFSTDIRHIAGAENQVSDFLSRLSVDEINYEKIGEAQENDSELENLLKSDTSLKFKKFTKSNGKIVWCDVSTDKIRPFVPKQFRFPIFQNYHSLAHPGVKATVKLIASKCVWPCMNRDIVKWAKACIPCQKSKITRHVKSPLGKYPEVDQRFDVVHIDIVGPLPISDGYLYCLTCIDRFSSWVEVIPLKNIDAETVAKNFFKEWIARFGTPLRIHCDQGRQFMSELFSSLAKLCGSQIQRTTPYHPQAQGKIERFHRTLKAAIRAHGQKKWTEVLPAILLGIRASIKLDANASIAEMLYGMPLRLPGDFFNETSALEEDPQEFVRELKKRMEELKPTPETQKSRFSPSSGSGLFRSRVPSAARPVQFRGVACAVSVRRENIEENQARKKEMLAIVNYMRALRTRRTSTACEGCSDPQIPLLRVAYNAVINHLMMKKLQNSRNYAKSCKLFHFDQDYCGKKKIYDQTHYLPPTAHMIGMPFAFINPKAAATRSVISHVDQSQICLNPRRRASILLFLPALEAEYIAHLRRKEICHTHHSLSAEFAGAAPRTCGKLLRTITRLNEQRRFPEMRIYAGENGSGGAPLVGKGRRRVGNTGLSFGIAPRKCVPRKPSADIPYNIEDFRTT